MHIVVTVRNDPFRGLTIDAFGPWELDQCERERTRLLAHAGDPFASMQSTGCTRRSCRSGMRWPSRDRQPLCDESGYPLDPACGDW